MNSGGAMIKMILFFKWMIFCVVLLLASASIQAGTIIPTDQSQQDFLKVYKLVLNSSNVDYRFTGNTLDSLLFPKWGEYSVYWVKNGQDKGSFVLPDAIPANYSGVSKKDYGIYDWRSAGHLSVQYKLNNFRIGIYRSNLMFNGSTVSWEYMYFKNLFDSYLFDNTYYVINEDSLSKGNINPATQLIIIPSFSPRDEDNKFYIDSIFAAVPNIKQRFADYLATGGTIYTEGNSVYFIEKLGFLTSNSVDFTKMMNEDLKTNLIDLKILNSDNPLTYASLATGDFLYTASYPVVDAMNAEKIATDINGNPVIFMLKGNDANNGRIICNLGLPTVGGSNYIKDSDPAKQRQLQWTLNAIVYAFTSSLDVNRSIFNDLPNGVNAGLNAVSYDRLDTFEVRTMIRNLSDKQIDNIKLTNYLRGFFRFVDVVTPNVNSSVSGNILTFSGISMQPMEEKVIVCRFRMPDLNDKIRDNVDKYISWATYIYESNLVADITDENGRYIYNKYRDYVDLMFSARIAADADLNWKNFLGLYYQPFKVFMIMENKERTSALNTKYVQYIPKDVPFYWTDKSINIPILKTPGGQFVDVLRGSNDENNPEFDMDSDGKPDVWLDTSSINPKNYTISEDSVYWLNPWEHLRTGDSTYYEDIDHDGKRALDLNTDGIVDVDEPGDKIRVWKVEWNIGKVNGYQYFDPYCYYEIWVDPPDLVPLSSGVGYANGKSDKIKDAFYPYSKDLENPDLKNDCWKNWMEKDKSGNVIWKQLIYQRINNYEGFTFIDTLKENYQLKPTDFCAGTVPQPHREFIAVLSLGGEEIDMNKFTPNNSLYSKITYNTIFNEARETPIRSTYTYYAPLPNPLQFEYLTNNFIATDDSGKVLTYLPKWGKANLTFNVDASTEYSYYWIRTAGHDVDYNDPSLNTENVDKLGDGVFGYMVYDLPKGIGGYKITLPTKPDGTYDINNIVQVDGKNFEKWLDNPNTKNEIYIYEDPYQYHIHIPQLLIPPAIDDDNKDGIDDWIDDRGDRFCSSTGFLHDGFMLDNGEQWLDWPKVPFKDDIYGMVTKGWYPGPDNTYGDDFFENLGTTHFKINAIYEGKGREGPLDLSKGGWLVVEEIFGGSPWVIFSHCLSGFAKGVDLRMISQAQPAKVRFGSDTVYMKHYIDDLNEPHNFDIYFDPYHASFGYGESTITTYAGGKDPCSLISPAVNFPAIIDPVYDKHQLTLVPLADKTNPDLKDYPKSVRGSFIEVSVEVQNGTSDNWINTTVNPVLPPELMNSKVIMNYVAYPRPLVPAAVDPVTGDVIHKGDDLGSFRAGWRFNQPEGEVLVKMGNKLNLLMPTRRAYFVFLIQIDSSLSKGVYQIDFNIDGERRNYTGKTTPFGELDVPSCMFSISKRDSKGNVTEYQKTVIGTSDLKNIKVNTTSNYIGYQNAKWSATDINYTDFDKIQNELVTVYDADKKTESIDLSQFKDFPSPALNKIYILEQGEANSYNNPDLVYLTTNQVLNYQAKDCISKPVTTSRLSVIPTGPKIRAFKTISTFNGSKVKNNSTLEFKPDIINDVNVLLEITNSGNDIAEGLTLLIKPESNFVPIADKLPSTCSIEGQNISAAIGTLIPGEKKLLNISFTPSDLACQTVYHNPIVVNQMGINYRTVNKQTSGIINYSYPDNTALNCPAYDIGLIDLSVNRQEVSSNKLVRIKTDIENGVSESYNVRINLFAVSRGFDTVKVGEYLIDTLSAFEKQSVEFDYMIPDSSTFFKVFAIVDNNNQINEICEKNNFVAIVIPFDGPDWILDISNTPNPFDYSTDVIYSLPNQISDLNIEVYSIDSRLIDVIYNCPVVSGVNSVHWLAPDLAKGVYILRFKGMDENGKPLEYIKDIVKEK